jgi:spore germination cell wall hydrolase CwlJ-like protein
MKNEYNTILQEQSAIGNINNLVDATPLSLYIPKNIYTNDNETPSVVLTRPLGANIRFIAPVTSLPPNPVSEGEFKCLVEAVYFESNVEPFDAMISVAEVIINRKYNKSWPNTICKVISQGDKTSGKACQFSYRCDGKKDKYTSTGKLYLARLAAYTALVNDTDITNGATHYHADYSFPKWRKKMIRLTKIGRHIFYRRKKDSVRVIQTRLSSKSIKSDLWMNDYITNGGNITNN